MAVYLCRWPNGEFSIVSAKTKNDAIELLEWGNAEQARLTRMSECMLDFRLDDDGQIELASIGETTHACITETCYPGLDRALATAEVDETGLDYSAKGREQIREAVAREPARKEDAKKVKRGELHPLTGLPDPIRNRHQGWQDPVPVHRLADYSGPPCNRTFREFFPLDAVGPMPPLPIEERLVRTRFIWVFRGRPCCRV